MFASLLTEAADDERSLLTFLAQAYKFKEIGDYGVGEAAVVTDEDAKVLIAGAERFLRVVATWLSEALTTLALGAGLHGPTLTLALSAPEPLTRLMMFRGFRAASRAWITG